MADNFKDKLKYLDTQTATLDSLFGLLSEYLYEAIVNDFADKLERKDGKILANQRNVNYVASIEATYNKFSEKYTPRISTVIADGFNMINAFNVDYFSTFDGFNDYALTTQKIQKIIRNRLGITAEGNGKTISLVPGGYMDSLLKDNTIKNQIKNLSYNEVLKGSGFESFKKGLKNYIIGNSETVGGFRQFYRNYAYDIFVNIDRQESTLLAIDLDLKYFFYEGTLIKTSRQFCIDRAGKLFSIKEALKWVNDPWIKQAFAKGYISSYNPTSDMGLWACRHIPRYISKEVAWALRPELKNES